MVGRCEGLKTEDLSGGDDWELGSEGHKRIGRDQTVVVVFNLNDFVLGTYPFYKRYSSHYDQKITTPLFMVCESPNFVMSK